MATSTTSRTQDAQIRVLRADAEPASILLEIDGQDHTGQTSGVRAVFDARTLAENLFPSLFLIALEQLVSEARDAFRASRVGQPTLDVLETVDQLGLFPPTFAGVVQGARFLATLEARTAEDVCAKLLQDAARGIRPPKGPAPAECWPGSPPRDGTGPLKDRVANSSVSAGGEHTSEPERAVEAAQA